jgi:hypothetical protein
MLRAAVYLRYRLPADLELAQGYCERRGWQVVDVYTDLQALYADVQSRQLDIVVAPSMEHLIGTSALDPFNVLRRLLGANVAFASASPEEETFCTLGPGGAHMAAIAAWLWRHQFPPGASDADSRALHAHSAFAGG